MCVYGTHSMRLVQRTSLRQSPADCFAPARPARSMCYFRYFRSPRNLSKVVKCQEVSHFRRIDERTDLATNGLNKRAVVINDTFGSLRAFN